MTRVLGWPAVLTAGIATVVTALATASVIAAPAAPAHGLALRAANNTALRATDSTGSAATLRTILLITGDRLAVTSDPARPRSSQVIAPLPGSLSAGLATIRLGAENLKLPYDALPYLGHGLDPSLFSVPALLSHETDGRLPVTIRFAGPRPSLPGITITTTGPGSAVGYLTATSAKAFGAALARQFALDHASGNYGTDGMFGASTSISLAGAGLENAKPGSARATRRAGPVSPGFRLITLTFRGTNLTGQPDTGDAIFVFNVDDPLLLNDLVRAGQPFVHGAARFSVPVGRYFAVAVFFKMDHRRLHGLRLTVLPQFTVSGSATTVRVAARAADSEIAMATPRPSVMQDNGFQLDRVPATGSPLIFQFEGGHLAQWVSPTSKRPTAGSLQTITSEVLTSPTGAASPYLYNLSYQDLSGTIPSQQRRIRAASLATVAEPYYSAVQAPGFIQQAGAYPVQLATLSDTVTPIFDAITGPVLLPLEYLTASPALVWFTLINRFQGLACDFCVEQSEARTFKPGQRFDEDWNRYPLHPAPDERVPGGTLADPLVASATRAGNQFTMLLNPFTDNTAGHVSGEDAGFAGSYQIDQNGTQIAAGDASTFFFNSFFFTQATLSPSPSDIALTLDVNRDLPVPGHTRTTWTWKSAREPGRLPSGWLCGTSLTGLPTVRCAAQPLLTLAYQVTGLRLDGSAPPGQQTLNVTVGRMQPAASTAKITTANVAVSFDNGATWQNATMTRGSGNRFAASYTTPPTASSVALRVNAADTAGAAITETIWNAYQITAGAATAGHAATETGSRVTAGPWRWVPGGRPPGPAGHGPGEKYACPFAPRGYARCFALYSPQVAVNQAIAAGLHGPAVNPQGWGPRQLEAAYKLPVNRTSHQTVAVSIAFNTPKLEQYLAVYRKHYGLPPCTIASGCFRKVSQLGRAGPLPQSGVGSGWDLEATLDVSMISAACPHCHILVVEARNNSLGNLAISDNTAVRLGAQVISNSYGSPETGASLRWARDYDHPGHVIVASSGDFGYTQAQFPANLTTVTAAGGTELSRARDARGWSEAAWITPQLGATGSGCSAYVAKPAWQHDRACPMRTTADISAVADHVAIYNADYGGWVTVDGTSVSAPFIAGIYGLAGNAAHLTPGYEYRHAGSLFDVTRGNNDFFNGTGGAGCDLSYLCVARTGYDGPTGLGTPDGIGAF